MHYKNEIPSKNASSVKPVSLYLQTRPFAPPTTEEEEPQMRSRSTESAADFSHPSGIYPSLLNASPSQPANTSIDNPSLQRKETDAVDKATAFKDKLRAKITNPLPMPRENRAGSLLKKPIQAKLNLTHVVQQSHQIQREEEEQTSELTPTIIVEDSTSDLSSGQMTKSKFLQQLYQEICKIGSEVYQGTNLTVEGCPYIERWFARYSGEDSRHVESAIRKYVSGQRVATALELIEKIGERSRKGFTEQVKTGRIAEIPDGVSEKDGEGIIPRPEMIVQEKPIQRMSVENGEKTNVIQRGCLKSGGAAAPAVPAPIVIRDGDNPNWQFIPNANPAILQTSPMGDCWALIIVTPAGRILAHLPTGDAGQLNGGGVAAINAHLGAGGVVTIVMGEANQDESAYLIGVKYATLAGLALAAGAPQTRAGFWTHASVDNAGNINTW
ncbi:MAG: hypothetical protein ACK596_03495 [Pseudanabaena sp.]